MSRVLSNGASRDIQTLFTAGLVGGVSDEHLVERFAGRRGIEAEIAFSTLVERHGPMVHDVCRSVLGDWHDAQDAFQATFLVLALRAGSIRRNEAVGSWLFGVARRIALKARTGAARRHARERNVAANVSNCIEHAEPSDDQAILHEELGQLPEAYRSAIVLYHLEGRSYEQAAAELNCPVGTLKSRLARGRERLRRGLIRRGLVPAAALTLVQQVRAAASAVSPRSDQLVQSVLRYAADRSTDGVVSAAAAELSGSLLRSMNMTRFVTIFGIVAVGLAATGAAVFGFRPSETPRAPASAPQVPPATVPAPSKPAEKRMRDYHLRVVNLKGEPVPEVPIQVFEYKEDGIAARTDGDGRAKVAYEASARTVYLRALQGETAAGWGHWRDSELGPEGTADDPIILTLLPINHRAEGTVVDTDGEPIRDVRINVDQYYHPANASDIYRGGRREVSPLGSAVTDGAGRYTLLLPEGSEASLSAFHPLFVGTVNACKEDTRTIPPWTLRAGGRIVGFVIDGETRRPVANAKVNAYLLDLNPEILGGGASDAETNEAGRFEMGSLSTGVYNLFLATKRDGKSQLAKAIEGIRVIAGEDSRADLTIIAPRLLQGTAVDFKTGEPLVGVHIHYYSASHPRSGPACPSTASDEKGQFVCAVPPGNVHVFLGEQKYARNLESARDVTVSADGEVPSVVLKGGGPVDEQWRTLTPGTITGLVRRSKIAEVAGDGGLRTLRGRILDSNGRPIAGVRVVYSPPNPAPAPELARNAGDRAIGQGAGGFRGLHTDRDGTFLLDHVSSKPIQLQLTFNNSLETTFTTTVPADALEVEFTFPPPASE